MGYTSIKNWAPELKGLLGQPEMEERQGRGKALLNYEKGDSKHDRRLVGKGTSERFPPSGITKEPFFLNFIVFFILNFKI
jgi:hypothetical protein